MSELLGRSFLRALWHAGQQMSKHPMDHSYVTNALTALERAADVLSPGEDEAVITIGEEAFFLGRRALPHASLEFNGMLRELQGRGVDSITILRGASLQDLADLAALVAGLSNDLPAGGTVRLNERPLAPGDLEQEPMSKLRRTYASSLETLRSVSDGDHLELENVMGVVDRFVRGGAHEGRAALMLATVHNYDEVTYYHSVNVCLLSLALGRTLGLGQDHLRHLGVGALVHDIGRASVGASALSKPGRLSNQEWDEVRLHPQEGAQAIMAASGPGQEIAALIALEHHLRMDGGGYPDLGGRRPHLFSRIVSIADAYDAITSQRADRPARTPHEALRIVLDGAGEAYDSDLVRAFIHMMGIYPPGSLLRLDTGEVVMIAPASGDTPRAVIVRDVAGAAIEEPEPVDLDGRVIVAQLLPDQAGIDPAALLEAVDQGHPAGP